MCLHGGPSIPPRHGFSAKTMSYKNSAPSTKSTSGVRVNPAAHSTNIQPQASFILVVLLWRRPLGLLPSGLTASGSLGLVLGKDLGSTKNSINQQLIVFVEFKSDLPNTSSDLLQTRKRRRKGFVDWSLI